MRKYAYEVVYETMENGMHSDTVLHRIMRKRTELTPQQKSFIKRLSYGTIERAIEMDAILNQYANPRVKQMDSQIRTILRMALYEIRYMEQVPDSATCNEAVELAKEKECGRYSGFVNGVLRHIIREKDEIKLRDDWVKLSMPKDLMEHLVEQYGKKTAKKIAASFLENKGEITLHVDTNKISTDDYKKLLENEGIESETGYYWEDALRVTKINDVAMLPGYEEGVFYVQDESSMLPVHCAGITKGQLVVDVCGAPGGKSIHALQCLNKTGNVSCRDLTEYKVSLLGKNMLRMGYENVTYKVWDATIEDTEWTEKADVVLADVPCSGIGIIGRKPEIKYRALSLADELIPIQRMICRQAVKMIKLGGVLIYSTCTINPHENEENVQWLEENCGLQRESLNAYIPETLQNGMTERGMLQMLPGVQKSDGFFVARLIKK